NTVCGACGHKLAYLPDLQVVASLDPAGGQANDPQAAWTCPIPRARDRTYRLCDNYTSHNVCNWAIDAAGPDKLCLACRLTRVIPDLSRPENQALWARLEAAKRRLVYELVGLGLPVAPRADENPKGIEFRFLADPPGGPRVLTGHDNGVITVNIAEADDVERERARVSMHEPYRTLLGHFRHEIGHYYWDLLIKDGPRLEPFRQRFGDERPDYNRKLQAYYRQGPMPNWQQNFVTAYAAAHPWEDWAETWAHYLHMADALETAAACGLSLHPDRADEPSMEKPSLKEAADRPFEQIVQDWFALTYALNSLNRSMGLPDGYPFALSEGAIAKLRFVHEAIGQCREGEAPSEVASASVLTG
ncbi:MAG TPA: putative zinc-binding metallopeptidase, partial [Tepidisphaeraceae bacterium]|nr:putative zinc-binding metallopeptidase [Tepidisphaeraceae bacterium]